MFKGVIYCVICIHNNKKYYGYTQNFIRRKKGHLKTSKEGIDQLFYRALRKHGIENFNWIIIEKYENENEKTLHKILCEREIFWIEKDKTYLSKFGYNMTHGGDGGAFYGENNGMFNKHHKKESLIKMSNTAKTNYTEERKIKHSNDVKGEKNGMFGKNYQTYGIVNRAKENTGKTYEEIFGDEKAEKIKKQMSESHIGEKKNLKEVTCPYCNLIGKGPNMTRYHFDKCKNKTI
jgi:group I intron endonuclease